MSIGHFSTVVMLLALASSAPGQQPTMLQFHHTEVFGQLLLRDLEPLQSFKDVLHKRADQVVVVLFGELQHLDIMRGGDFERFHREGGSILLASDRPMPLPAWNITIEKGTVNQSAKDAYRGLQTCPLLLPPPGPHHPLLQEVRRLATNRAAVLSHEQKSMVNIISFPQLTWIDNDKRRVHLGSAFPYAVASREGAGGRIIVLGGHGVFLNGMLLQMDNDNLRFARNCIDWLCARPLGEEPPKYVLFVENGKVVGSPGLKMPLPPLRLPPVPPIEVFNEMLRGLEDENFFNRAILSFFGERNVQRFFLVAASLAALFYGAWRLMRSRFWIDKRVPLVFEEVRPARTETPLEQRFEALAESDNYWELGQVLAREWFWRHANIEPSHWQHAHFEGPAFDVRGSWWQRRRWRRGLRQLRAMARSTPTWPLAPTGVRSVQQAALELTQAIQRGALAVGKDSDPD